MDPNRPDKRREPRLAVRVGAAVRVRGRGRLFSATSINLSGCGALLRFEEPLDLAVGDSVTCELEVSSDDRAELPCWVDGTVVRVAGADIAIDFRAGCWNFDGSVPSPSDER
jgi:hypothetical protein